jgi:hypothetical protein
VNPEPGMYHEEQSVTVAAVTGVTVRYSMSGSVPTESDPILPSGDTILVDRNTTIAVRAWMAGRPSEPVIAAYELQPLEPTVSVAGGLYTSAQTVTLQAAPGTTIRYTVDGSEPTPDSPVYEVPLVVDRSLTLRARAFRDGWTPSPVLLASYDLNYGTLSTPSAAPRAGIYASSQVVTLQADPGATIRFTTDGSLPTAASFLYSGPITVDASVTIKARAFRPDWTSSPVLTETYTIDGSHTLELLQYTVEDTSLEVQHTSADALDWVHWGGSTTPDRKAAATPLISELAVMGTATAYQDSFISYGWSDGDGTPATASGVHSGLAASGIGNGFQFTVPAATTVRTLRLYVGAARGVGTLTVNLGDAPVATFVDSSVDTYDRNYKTYEIDFRASSPGQLLTISFVQSRDYGTEDNGIPGFITLEAAVLTPHRPAVSLEIPADGASFPLGTTVALVASASQYEGTLTGVEFLADGSVVQSASEAPFATAWTPTEAGHHQLVARASDTAGLLRTSHEQAVDIIGAGGALTVTLSPPTPVTSLSMEGTSDWILWGRESAAMPDRKFGVTPLISGYTVIGNHQSHVVADRAVGFLYGDGDGAGTASPLVASAVRVYDRGQGYQLTVNAETVARTLRLHVGLSAGRARLRAFLTDGSANVVTDTQFESLGSAAGVYAITFRATSSGQALVVQYILEEDYGRGFVELAAATLDGPAANGPMITAVSPSKASAGMVVDIVGSRFGTQQGGSTVMVDGRSVETTYWSETLIRFQVPPLMHSGTLHAVVGGYYSNGVPFEFALGARTQSQGAYIVPDEMRLIVGDSRPLTLVDPQGQLLSDVTWSVDDVNVAEIVVETDPDTGEAIGNALEARSPGHVIITAVSSQGTARAQATVYAGSVPAGLPRWEVYPDTTENWFVHAVKAEPHTPNDPVLYLTEWDSTGGTSLRALNNDGDQLWRTHVAGSVTNALSTADGGILLDGGGLTKVSTSGDTVWSLAADPERSVIAVGHDDTIYGYVGGNYAAWDGASGVLRYTANHGIPAGTLTVSCPEALEPIPLPVTGTGPIVAANGHLYSIIQTESATFASRTSCTSTLVDTPIGEYTSTTDTYLIEMTPNGPGSPVLVSSDTGTAQDILGPTTIDGSYWFRSDFDIYNPTNPYVVPSTLVYNLAPDSAGGVLFMIDRQHAERTHWEQSMVRVAGGGVQYRIGIPDPGGASDVTVTDDGLTLLSSWTNNATALEPVSGAVRWSIGSGLQSPLGTILSTTDTGGAVFRYFDTNTGASQWTLTEIDENGAVVGSATVPGSWESVAYAQLLSDGELLVQDSQFSSFAMVGTDLPAARGKAFPTPEGSAYGKVAKGITVKEDIEAGEEKDATGYDRGATALMVPLNGQNTILVRVPKNGTYDFAPDSALVSISPASVVGTGQSVRLTLTGLATGTTTIIASEQGTPRGFVFHVDVKARKDITLRLIDAVDTPRSEAQGLKRITISPANLQKEVDAIFPRQANVYFHVDPTITPVESHYDVISPHDNKLQLPSTSNSSTEEVTRIRADLAAAGRTIDSTHWDVTYVYEINGKSSTGGFSNPLSPEKGIFIGRDWPVGTQPGYIDSTAAHELGHVLGRGGRQYFATGEPYGFRFVKTPDHSKCGDCLMYYNYPPPPVFGGTAPRRKLRRDDWNTMNFVRESPIPVDKKDSK